MRLYKPGLPARVQADDKGEPLLFTLQGRIHKVEHIEEHREPRLGWWDPWARRTGPTGWSSRDAA